MDEIVKYCPNAYYQNVGNFIICPKTDLFVGWNVGIGGKIGFEMVVFEFRITMDNHEQVWPLATTEMGMSLEEEVDSQKILQIPIGIS